MSSPVDHVGHIIEQWAVERPELDVSPIGIIGRLHRLSATLYTELDTVYSEHGLGDGEFDVLATLRRTGRPYALTPSELAEQTMVTSGAVTKRVDRLMAAGLVTREVNARDARSRVVALSPRGLRLIDSAFAAHVDNERRLVGHLTDREQRLLATLLEKWGRALGA